MEKYEEIDKKTLEKGEKKLKVGDYVRTKYGHIGKIKEFTIQIEIKEVDGELVDTPTPAIVTDTYYYASDENDVWEETDIKSSGKSLGDVIEHGDLVNMLLVLNVYEPIDREKSCFIIEVIDGHHTVELTEDDIRHVVCREILERNGYKNEKDV